MTWLGPLEVGPIEFPGSGGTRQEVALTVEEKFEGLPADVLEVTVLAEGPWLLKGNTYLIDAVKGSDGRLRHAICGGSGEIESRRVQEFLEFLRMRARGEAKTSLTISTRDQYVALPGVNVTISGSTGTFSAIADSDGKASFPELAPATYSIRSAKEHYGIDEDHISASTVTVLSGTCPAATQYLKARNEIGGEVRDVYGATVPGMPLELIAIADEPDAKKGVQIPFHAVTDREGRFRFTAVSPGRYYLGTNLMDSVVDAPIPRTYYPGRRSRNDAIPINVEAGSTLDRIIFTMPDYGPGREISVLVIDDAGRPVADAQVGDAGLENSEEDRGGIGFGHQTDAEGLVSVVGYEGVKYRVWAMSSEADFRSRRASEEVEIPAGKGPIQIILSFRRSKR